MKGNALITLLAFIQAIDALRVKFIGIPVPGVVGLRAYDITSKVVPIFCMDRLMDMNEKTSLNHSKWTLELYNPTFGKRIIENAQFQTLSELIREKQVSFGNRKSSSNAPTIIPAGGLYFESIFGAKVRLPWNLGIGSEAVCWGTVVDLKPLQLKASGYYRWILRRKRYLIDRKRFRVRWFTQSFKSSRIPIFEIVNEPNEQVEAFHRGMMKLICPEESEDARCYEKAINQLNGENNWYSNTKRAESDETALHAAASSGNNTDLVGSSTASGEDENAQDGIGETATIKELDANQSLIDVNMQEKSAPELAIEKGNVRIAKPTLVSLDDPKSWEKYGALKSAALSGETEIVIALIGDGAPVDSGIANSPSPLNFAADGGRLEIVKSLIDAGADLNCKDYAEITPLIGSLQRGYVEVARALVDAGADVNMADMERYTPLMVAVQIEQMDAVRFLISAGADVNAKNVYGETALNFACRRKNQELVDLLIKLNAKKGWSFSICRMLGN